LPTRSARSRPGNDLEGLDLVLEGAAAEVTGDGDLRTIADTYELKYGRHFAEPGRTWAGLGDAIRGGDVVVYRVAPRVAFGFGKEARFSQTRWRFS